LAVCAVHGGLLKHDIAGGMGDLLPKHVILRSQQTISYVTFDVVRDFLRRRQGQTKVKANGV
jgi:hypothetical protein